MLAQVGVIYRWLAATQSWTSFRPGAPAILSAFDTFATGGSYWIAVAEEVEWVVGVDGGLSAAALSPPQHRASQAEGRGFESLLPLQLRHPVAKKRRVTGLKSPISSPCGGGVVQSGHPPSI